MTKRDKYFSRKRSERPRVDFFVEGKVTELNYLIDLKNFLVEKFYPSDINKQRIILGQIDIPNPGDYQDCKNLTERAIEEVIKNKNAKDKVFVVIDEDDRTSSVEKSELQRAIKKANDNGIYFIYSIPNIEFWALLHFEYCQNEMSKDECLDKLNTYLPNYKKRLDFLKMQNNIQIAIDRAKKVRKFHGVLNNKEIDLINPTTNAFIIIEELEDFIRNFPD